MIQSESVRVREGKEGGEGSEFGALACEFNGGEELVERVFC